MDNSDVNEGNTFPVEITGEDDKAKINPVDAEYDKEQTKKVRERTLQEHFQHLSSDRKIDLITKMFYETRRLNSLSSLRNIFFSVDTKLLFYSKVSNDSNSLYEQLVHDHDRMLDTVVLQESLVEHIQWFKTLQDTDQIDIMTNLLRLSGGYVIKKMYWRLLKIFNERAVELEVTDKKYTSRTSMVFLENIEKRNVVFREYQVKYPGENENDYNPDCPTHKKVIEGKKHWQSIIGKLKREVETEIQKLNEPNEQNKATKKPHSAKKGGRKKNKKQRSQKSLSPRPKSEGADWFQLLPVWTIKKIFSYLDKKDLQNIKKVGNYWSVISKEVLAEQKMRVQLDSTIKKAKENFDHLLGTSMAESEIVIEKPAIVMENTTHRRRLEKQRRTATSLKLFYEDPNTLHTKTLLPECFQMLETEFQSLLKHLRPFPVGIPIINDYVNEEPKQVDLETASEQSKIFDDVTPQELNKFVTYDQETHNKSDTVDIMSVASIVPSIVVSSDNLILW